MSFMNMNFMKNNFIQEKKYTELPSRLNITHRKVHIFNGAKRMFEKQYYSLLLQ